MSELHALKGRIFTRIEGLFADCRCGNLSPSDVREAIEAVFAEEALRVPFNPKFVTPTVISVWANTQCIREVMCPRCQSGTPFDCFTPSGRQRKEPHLERLRAYREKIGDAEFKRRHQRGPAESKR